MILVTGVLSSSLSGASRERVGWGTYPYARHLLLLPDLGAALGPFPSGGGGGQRTVSATCTPHLSLAPPGLVQGNWGGVGLVHPILTWTPTPIPAQPGPAGSQPCTSPQNLQLDVLHLVQHPPDVLLEVLGGREGKAGPPTPLPPPSPLILWVLPLGTY